MNKKGFTYTLKVDAEIKNLLAKAATVKESLKSFTDAGKVPGIEKVFSALEKSIDRLQQKASQPIETVAMFKSVEKDAQAVTAAISKLGEMVGNLGSLSDSDKLDLLPEDLKKRIEEADKAIKTFTQSVEKAEKKSENLANAEKDLASAKKELTKAEGKVSDKKALIQASQEEIKSIQDKKKALEQYLKTQEAYEKAGADKRVGGDKTGKAELAGMSLPKDRAAAAKAAPTIDVKDTSAVEAEIARLNQSIKESENSQKRYAKSLNEWQTAAKVAGDKVAGLEAQVNKLNDEFEQNKSKNVQNAYASLRNEAEKLGTDLSGIPLDYTEQGLEQLKAAMQRLASDGVAEVDRNVDQASNTFDAARAAAEDLSNSMDRSAESVADLDERVSNTQAFASRIKQFLGLQGAATLARIAFRNAFDEVKKLDAAMTEMAVVTDLEIGDYWRQLPEHTKRANALGLAIEDVYKAETLYYQQGLKTNEVVAMSTETLKMARIAGLSAEDATNKMTAALRGFNMELNETSAQKVADVYSELAAITASDVNEISSAMTKTASIAASAGMEFETTAAFLSQIIETTRESAETAGTALKTVIARFQELKKDPSEIGEIDGEVVDANKIETALRSVGVSLRDTSGQFRELDDVFLELASKWDGLDTNTQRYIATIAAGSRQQSRFIAMMSDYSRTQELVLAANNSAGASNEQFEKTLDSLASRLNQLKNAWDTFTMGIMDNEFLKVGISLLTALLETLNHIADFMDQFGMGGATRIGMVVAALYLGDKALKVFLGSLNGGSTVFQSFGAVGRAAIDSISARFVKLNKNLTGMKKVLAENQKTMKTFGKVKIKADTSSAVASMNEFQKATNNQATALKLRDKISQDSAISEEARQAKLAKLDAIQVANEKRKTAAVAEYAAIEGLSNEQAAVAMTLQTMGIGPDTAKMAALGGLTAAKMAEYQATMIANGVSEAEIATKMASIVAIYAKAGAQTVENTTEKTGIALLWSKIAAGVVNIVTTVAQTIAQWAYNVAVYAGCPPTLAFAAAILIVVAVAALAIAAVVGLVAGIIALIKAFKANSPEGRLEAAKEAAAAAADAAKQAKEAYEGLAEAFDSLSDKYNALEDLTEGTREWRDAVKEINAEVLDLVDQYPELANLVTNENGVLTIDLDGEEAQAVLDKYEAQAVKTNSMEIASKMSVARAQTEVDRKALSDKATVGSEFGITLGYIGAGLLASQGIAMMGVNPLAGGAYLGGGMGAVQAVYEQEQANKRNTDAMAQALAEGLLVEGTGGYTVTSGSEEALAELGLSVEEAERFAKELGDGAEELKEYGKAVKERTEQEKALYEAAALNAVQMVDTSKMSEEEANQINVAASEEYAKVFESQAMNEIQSQLDDMSKGDRKDWISAKAQEMYGTSEIEVDGSGNVTIGTGDNKKTVTSDNFKKQLALYEGTENAAEALEHLPAAIDKVSAKMGSAGKAFENTFNGKEGSAVTGNDLERLKDYTNNIHRLGEIYHSLSETEQAAFGSFENFERHVYEAIKLSEAAFTNASKGLKDMGISIQFNGDMTAEAAKGYASQLETIAITAGEANVKQINTLMNRLTDTLNPEQLKVFMREINSLDWTNQTEWDKLPDILSEVGLSLPITELEAFIKEASESANAIKKIDFTIISEGMNTLQGLIRNLRNGESGGTIDSEEYERLIEINPELVSSFGETIDGEFAYLGGSIETLISTIQENTDAWVEREQTGLTNKVEAGRILQDLQANKHWNGIALDVTRWKDWDGDAFSDSSAENFLERFISDAQTQGIDLNQLGIKNLTNSTNIQALAKTPEKLEQVMNDLSGVLTSLNSNIHELNYGIMSELSKIYQNRNIAYNQQDIQSYRAKIASGQKLDTNEQVQYEAYQQTIQIQAKQAGVNSVDYDNYAKMVVQAQNLEKAYAEGRISLEEFENRYAETMERLSTFETKIVNVTSMRNMKANMTATFEQIGESFEAWLNTSENDVEGKMETIAEAVSKFGIQVTEENYETLGSLVDLTLQGGETGIQALAQLLDYAAAKYGVTQAQFLAMEEQNWEKASDNQILYAEKMVQAGMAEWKILADGTRQFVWATQGILEEGLNNAGVELEKWENTYNRLWNLNEALNGTMRERNRLEKEYERALASSTGSAQELTDIIAKQMLALHQEAFTQSEIAKESLATMNNLSQEYSKFSDYYKFDPSTGVFTVDTKAVESSNWSAEMGEEFDNFVSEMQDASDSYNEAVDSLDDVTENLEELKEIGKSEQSKIYNLVKDGLVKRYEDQIEQLSIINESIQNAATQVVDKIQASIDDQRAAREQEKALRSLEDKQLRLAFLKRDTSGGNAMEIAALEKEIQDDQESLVDSLVDAEIEKLQEQNDEAAQQRERQIELARAQLERYVESGEIWNEVKRIADEGFSAVATGQSLLDTKAGSLILEAENLNTKNPIEREQFVEELETSATLGAIGGGFTSVSDAVADLSTAQGTSLASVATVISTSIGLMGDDIEATTTAIGTLGNTSIPNAVGNASKAVLSGLSALYSSSGSMSNAVKAALSSGLSSISGSVTSLKSSIGGLGTSISSALSASLYSGANAIVSAIKGIKINRDTGGGANTGTKPTEQPIINEPVTPTTTTPPPREPDYLTNKENLGTQLSYKEFNDWAKQHVAEQEAKSQIPTVDEIILAEKKSNVNMIPNEKDWFMHKGESYIAVGKDGYYIKSKDLNSYILRDRFGYPYRKLESPSGAALYKKKYKTGGLADFTGPAWLDGTKSKPEIVLNQTDSANFMQLRDILAEILNGTSGFSRSNSHDKGGDNYYDIDITVESLGDDYEVEQLADKIRDMIYEDSVYRNVNSINSVR